MSGKNSILGLSEPYKSWISWYFNTYVYLKFHAQLSWARKNVLYPRGQVWQCVVSAESHLWFIEGLIRDLISLIGWKTFMRARPKTKWFEPLQTQRMSNSDQVKLVIAPPPAPVIPRRYFCDGSLVLRVLVSVPLWAPGDLFTSTVAHFAFCFVHCKKFVDFTVKYLATSCRYFYGRLFVEHF